MALESTFIAPSNHPTQATALRNFVRWAFDDEEGRLTGFTPTPGTGMQMQISPGAAVVKGTASGQGAYFVHNGSSENVAWPAAAAQARIDALVLVVADSDYGSIPGSLGPSWKVVTGTPGVSPVAPTDGAITSALNTGGAWYRFANVLIPGSATSISGGNITNVANTIGQEGSPTIISEVTREVVADLNVSGATGTWISAASWMSPINITIPPSGKMDIIVGANLKVDNSTLWSSYGLSGAVSRTVSDNGFRWGVKGGDTKGMRAHAFRRHVGLPPGGTLTITPYYYRFGGSSPTLDNGFLQAIPVYLPGDV